MVPAFKMLSFKMLSQTPTNPAYHRLNQIIMRYNTHLYKSVVSGSANEFSIL